MLRRIVISAAVLVAAEAFNPALEPAAACPMCQVANETDDRRPRAYMYSILFMLSVPATVFAGFGIGFYRLARKAEAMRNGDERGDGIQPFDE